MGGEIGENTRKLGELEAPEDFIVGVCCRPVHELYNSVAVSPVPVRVPTEQPLDPSFSSVVG